jgi:hypothetical protein
MVARPFPKDVIRKIESRDSFPLMALTGMNDLRAYLDEAETEAIIKAREMGAAVEDIADAIGLTRQGVYYRLKALRPDQGSNGGDDALGTDQPGAAQTAVTDLADTRLD